MVDGKVKISGIKWKRGHAGKGDSIPASIDLRSNRFASCRFQRGIRDLKTCSATAQLSVRILDARLSRWLYFGRSLNERTFDYRTFGLSIPVAGEAIGHRNSS
jgi:hypothetical protein